MKDLDKNNKYTDTPEKGISEYDVVNKPRHYNRDGAMECIDEMILLFGPAETASYCIFIILVQIFHDLIQFLLVL